MWMELQAAAAGGKATTRDFLSHYASNTKVDAASSTLIHHHDPRPSTHQAPGFMLKTHDFLRPLDNKSPPAPAVAPAFGDDPSPPGSTRPLAPDINVPAAPPHSDHLLPGGIGTYSVNHVPATRPLVVKAEWPVPTTGELLLLPGRAAAASTSGPAACTVVCPAGWPNAKDVVKGATTAATLPAAAPPYTAGAFSVWGNSQHAPDKPASRAGAQPSGPPPYQQHPPHQSHPILHHQQRHQQHPHTHHQLWASPPVYATARSSNNSFGSLSSTRSQATQDKRWYMDAAASNFSKGFTDDDEDDDGFGRREGTSAKELTVRVDGKNSTIDQKPSTPRSKHSATEQRRRSKINDRFQILRNLIPHTDQKRDKASFLLEVIEYIQFLQEKVQRYENEHPGWNQDNTNIPWKPPAEGTSGPSQVPQNGSASRGYVSSGEAAVVGGPVVLTNSQTPLQSENVSSGLPSKPSTVSAARQLTAGGGLDQQQQQRLSLDTENVAYQSQAQSVRAGNEILNQQELTIDDGAISISSVYSQGILNALAHALQSSGVDLSQASVSVQINLGRRAFNRPVSVPNEGPSSGNQMIGHSRSGSSSEESEKAKKRQKSSKS